MTELTLPTSSPLSTGEKLNQPVEFGNVSVTMLQLSNIAWDVQRELSLMRQRQDSSTIKR